MIELIQAATLSENNEARTQATQQIKQSREENTKDFFLELCKVFASEEVFPKLRQSAGILLSSSITTSTANEVYWDRLESGFKKTIKDSVLGALIAKDRSIRRAAANVVAAICCIQIPRNEWSNIISNLTGNVKSTNQTVREISIITLGFICDGLKKRNHAITPDMQESILSAILLGVADKNQQIRNTALKTFRDSLYSMNNVLQNSDYRDYVIKSIVEQINNHSTCIMALQVLNQFCEHYYPLLESYISGLYGVLEPIIRNSSDKNEQECTLAMEFWETLAEQYKTRQQNGETVKNYLQGQMSINLCKFLLQNLCVMNSQDQDGENPIHDSAVKTLERICQCGSTHLVQTFVSFTKNTFSHADWKLRQASIQSFSIVLMGMQTSQANNMVSNSIVDLMGLMNDNIARVKYSVLESCARMSEFCGQAILRHQRFMDILKVIMTELSTSEESAIIICNTLKSLTKAANDKKLPNFSGIGSDVIDALIRTCMNENSSVQVLNNSMVAIMDIIDVAKNDELCLRQINFILQNFDKLGQISSDKRKEMESGFLTIIQTCLLTSIGRQILSPSLLEQVYALVTEYFRKIKDVSEDGMYVLGALTHFMPSNVDVLNNVWGYIEHALRQYQIPDLFKATLHCIETLSRKYQENMASKLTFIPQLLNLMQDSSFDRQSKLDILTTLGDIVLYCKRTVTSHIDEMMRVILLFCEGAFQLINIDFSFSEAIKECVVDTLFCVFYGLCDLGNGCPQLVKHLESIFKFIEMSVNKASRPTVDFIKKCMLLVVDLRRFYPGQVDQYTNKQYVSESLESLQKFNKNDRFTKDITYIKSNF